MSRPLRIEFENAFYHVMNRGRNHQQIFPEKPYYAAFLDYLETAHECIKGSVTNETYLQNVNDFHLSPTPVFRTLLLRSTRSGVEWIEN